MSDCDSDCEKTEAHHEKLSVADIIAEKETVVSDEKNVNSDNLEDIEAFENEFCFCSTVEDDDDEKPHVESATDPTLLFLSSFLVFKPKELWTLGLRLKVKILDTAYKALLPNTIKMLTDLINKTQNGACDFWNQVCYVNFEMVTSGDADIRIAFNGDDKFSSKVGMAGCKSVKDQSLRTMSLGFRNDTYPTEIIYRKILHEFGHAIGFYHEHKNPNKKFTFNEEKVKDARPKWTAKRVRRNILDPIPFIPGEEMVSSEFDELSIMEYAFTKEQLIGYNKDIIAMPTLSRIDREKAAQAYPFPKKWP